MGLMAVLVGLTTLLIVEHLPTLDEGDSDAEVEPSLDLRLGSFADLPGWNADSLEGFRSAFLRSCGVFAKRSESRLLMASGVAGTVGDWRPVCAAVEGIADGAGGSELRRILAEYLQPWAAFDHDQDLALLTGYYEASLAGSRTRTDRFSTPLYRRPADLVAVDLGEFREDLRGRRLAGRVVGGRLNPYSDRRELEEGALENRGLELAWVDDAVDAFFLHIQGSGRVDLDNGDFLRVGYAAQNGHPYFAIGRELVKRGEMIVEEVSMQSIRAWLAANPDEASALMQSNPSYIFFRELRGEGPIGSQGVALEPRRSLAVDRRFLPLGIPVWLDGTAPAPDPGIADRILQRLVVTQDTGGAIRGPLRGDVFWGYGPEAEEIAGRMRNEARFWLLLPKDRVPVG